MDQRGDGQAPGGRALSRRVDRRTDACGGRPLPVGRGPHSTQLDAAASRTPRVREAAAGASLGAAAAPRLCRRPDNIGNGTSPRRGAAGRGLCGSRHRTGDRTLGGRSLCWREPGWLASVWIRVEPAVTLRGPGCPVSSGDPVRFNRHGGPVMRRDLARGSSGSQGGSSLNLTPGRVSDQRPLVDQCQASVGRLRSPYLPAFCCSQSNPALPEQRLPGRG